MKNKTRIPNITDDVYEEYQRYYDNIVDKYNVATVSRMQSTTKESLATEILRLKEYRKERGMHPLSTKQAIKIVATDQVTGFSVQQRKYIKESVREGAEYMDFDEGETVADRISSIIYRTKDSAYYNNWERNIKAEYDKIKGPKTSFGYYKRERFYEEFIFRGSQGDSLKCRI